MPIQPAKTKAACQPRMVALLLRLFFVLLLVISVQASPKAWTDEANTLVLRVESPEADVVKAVQQVTQDQIIHGTYSYDKERILYGAHSAGAARVFGVWKGPGKAYYKVADRILSPRFFKDSEDIGTISVRYVVQEESQDAAILRIDAVFVDARNVRHISTGTVESSEFAAIQTHLRNIQASRNQPQVAAAPAPAGSQPAQATVEPLALPPPPGSANDAPVSNGASVKQLQEQIESLRRQVFLRVKDAGASLKSAPFESAASISSLPAQTEVVIVVLTPYWYGVETKDGHRGWIHHSQLESLP